MRRSLPAGPETRRRPSHLKGFLRLLPFLLHLPQTMNSRIQRLQACMFFHQRLPPFLVFDHLRIRQKHAHFLKTRSYPVQFIQHSLLPFPLTAFL